MSSNATWIRFGVPVTVAGTLIAGGLIYVRTIADKRKLLRNERDLIDPRLPVSPSPGDVNGSSMRYDHSYGDGMTQRARRAYIDWLAGSRNEQDTYIGYVDLYFSGLERRLLSGEDIEEASSLSEEIQRLVSIYGGGQVGTLRERRIQQGVLNRAQKLFHIPFADASSKPTAEPIPVAAQFGSNQLSPAIAQDKAAKRNVNQRHFLHLVFFSLLRYDIPSPAGYFSLEERLYLVSALGIGGPKAKTHSDRQCLADLYYECGCLVEAAEIYESTENWRKLGEIAWRKGDEEGALGFFLRPSYSDGRHRERDADHVLRILFVRRDWLEFINTFLRSNIRHAFETSIVIVNLAVSGTPWLRRAAIAAIRAGLAEDAALAKRITEAFAVKIADWSQMLMWASQLTERSLSDEVEKARPKFLGRQPAGLKGAKSAGNTDRANRLLTWIRKASEEIPTARNDLKSWITEGDKRALSRFVELATGSGWFRLSEAFFQEVVGPYPNFQRTPDRGIELYRSHSDFLRLNFGNYLMLKLIYETTMSTEEVLSGVYQSMSFFEIESGPTDTRLTGKRLFACEDWALFRLDEWRRSKGEALLMLLRNEAFARSAELYDARKLSSWKIAITSALNWLDNDWQTMIGVSPWISENLMYSLLKEHFRKFEVLQHDRPAWLAPQHLDVHVPHLRLGIEYMGLQHYEPVDIFGGEQGYMRTRERDARKLAACEAAGVNLVYVRYDDDLETAVKLISERYER
jgi:hypothetical protein